ncbi:uncharacterized protein EI90DRAFT_3161466 [Cantharellus anzutake]|uniref:uncharacterized protein n=1 Tax=Cantharellus anzutake TaxID=1750568 RepID=UPI001903D200|nr:uncharacterized protein EI90DRAFT_3161466 [Cantharellus anzutake]KAF8310057.1 hypothetical protein EI90DRAFT_3161466 [Cantharellus anzutake]
MLFEAAQHANDCENKSPSSHEASHAQAQEQPPGPPTCGRRRSGVALISRLSFWNRKRGEGRRSKNPPPRLAREPSTESIEARESPQPVSNPPSKIARPPDAIVSPGRLAGGGSPKLDPRKSSTSPLPLSVSLPLPRTPKRIIVCCDGTWLDGKSETRRWRYSNVLKLSRSISHEDRRHGKHIPQIVFYQSGLGTVPNVLDRLIDGAFGSHLAEKVQDAYAFIAQNYCAGDEIFLFGFSRGAYTARMVAMFIGEIGVLDRGEMDHFAEIFISYQKRGKTDDPKQGAEYDDILKPFQSGGLAKVGEKPFSIKVMGVFDTVGALGLPVEFGTHAKIRGLFDFPDKILGHHIERAYHAMALNEERANFDVTKFHQTERGRAKKQVLKQYWFTGSHSDVGGGYEDHDLSDIALFWMIAQVEDTLALDSKYVKSLPRPVGSWATQPPRRSNRGVFALGKAAKRQITIDHDTRERIHASVVHQEQLTPHVSEVLRTWPHLLDNELLPLELELRDLWNNARPDSKPDSQTVTTDNESKTQVAYMMQETSERIIQETRAVTVAAAFVSEHKGHGEEVLNSFHPTERHPHYRESLMADVYDELEL